MVSFVKSEFRNRTRDTRLRIMAVVELSKMLAEAKRRALREAFWQKGALNQRTLVSNQSS